MGPPGKRRGDGVAALRGDPFAFEGGADVEGDGNGEGGVDGLGEVMVRVPR